jgi:polysaccharide biosynthesis/export protein
MRGTRRGAIFLACILGLRARNGAASAYLLQPVNVLSLSVVGAPELTRSVPVEMDGTAWFPLIGEVAVAGTALRDMRRCVAQAYSVTPLDPAGGTVGAGKLARSSQVNVSISEYRPVYGTGAVLAPRAVEFRPGLTLQQAISPADAGDLRPRSQLALRESLEAAVVDLSRIYARIWSRTRLLGTDTPEDRQGIFVDGSDAVHEIAELEEGMVAALAAEREEERRAIEEWIARVEARLEALLTQKTKEEEGLRLDAEIAAQVRDLFAQRSPLAPASGMAEAQRSALVSASRVLQLEVAAEKVHTEHSDLRARAAAAEGGDRSELFAQLSDALTQARHERGARGGALGGGGRTSARRHPDHHRPLRRNSAPGERQRPATAVAARRRRRNRKSAVKEILMVRAEPNALWRDAQGGRRHG